ncbi:D-aminopeptidase-like protein [Cladobotryum mycophilum]|uniref:D-aminopeptidase-like protein n=1 Tax=Cladobotryum mycophilum TaxID=491253 RepID=A0ABR0SH28_9HYPO
MDWFNSPDFRRRAEEVMKMHHLPGFSIAILQDGQVASLAFGQAILDPPTPCTTNTLFDIASCSKSLTGVSVGLLVEDEKHPEVQWDAPVSKLLPEDFVMPDEEHTRTVTVDDIISHRSGMPRHDLSYMGPNAEHPDNAKSVTRSLRYLPLSATLRTKWQYNNMMFTVGAHLVEEKTQQSFSNFLEERIFGPLGMESTSLEPSNARAKGFGDRIAMGYVWDKKNKKYHESPSPECQEGEGAGSIITSANDFIKWVKGLVHREGPISEKVYQQLVRQRSIVNPSSKNLRPYTSPAFYGAGLETFYYRGHASVTHSGGIDGFGSKFTFLPDSKFGVVVCGNSDGTSQVSGILTRELIDEFLKIPKDERSYKLPKPVKSKKSQEKPLASKASQDEPENSTEEEEEEDDLHGSSDVSDDESDDEDKDEKYEVTPLPQDTPLEVYAGKFRHPGYNNMTVQIKDDKLFIDATDRSFPCTLELEHMSGGTEFKATLRALAIEDEVAKGGFVLEGGVATKLGLALEPELKDLIWFDRVKE